MFHPESSQEDSLLQNESGATTSCARHTMFLHTQRGSLSPGPFNLAHKSVLLVPDLHSRARGLDPQLSGSSYKTLNPAQNQMARVLAMILAPPFELQICSVLFQVPGFQMNVGSRLGLIPLLEPLLVSYGLRRIL